MRFLKYFSPFIFISIISFGQPNTKPQDSNGCMYVNEVSTLGIGIVSASDSFDIYNDSLLHDKYQSIGPHTNWDTRIFCPKFFKPDYGIMDFICIGKTTKAYKVIVNYSDVKYLSRKEYNFKTWDDYILESLGIDDISNSSDTGAYLVLKKEPNIKADTIQTHLQNGQGGYCPIEVKDDWVKVIYNCNIDGDPRSCHEQLKECKIQLTGWMQWKQGNKLLIRIYLIE